MTLSGPRDDFFAEFVQILRDKGKFPSTSSLDFDTALHICGQNSYPEFLEHETTMETFHHIDWTESHLRIINQFVNQELLLSEDSILEIQNLGGMWPKVLKNETYEADFYSQGLRKWTSLEGRFPGISAKIYELIDCTELQHLKYKVDQDAIDLNNRLANALEQRFGTSQDSLRNAWQPVVPKDYIPEFVEFQILRSLIRSVGPCKHFDEIPCAACGEMFYPQTTARSISVIGMAFCLGCYEVAMDYDGNFFKVFGGKASQREAAIRGIRQFVELAGFIPDAGFKPHKMLHKYKLTTMDPSEAADLVRAWVVFPSPRFVKTLYPTWAHFLNAADLLEETFSEESRGRRSISRCNHLCLSLGERYICEFLHRNKIQHTREPIYESHPEFNPSGKLRADFLIRNVWVEFAGLQGNLDYDKKIKNKVALAKALGIQLIVISPKDLDSLTVKLESILTK